MSFKKYLLSFYLKIRARQQYLPSTASFPHMPTTAKHGPIEGQEPQIPGESCTGEAEAQALVPLPAASQDAYQQEVGAKVELEFKVDTPMWAVGPKQQPKLLH